MKNLRILLLALITALPSTNLLAEQEPSKDPLGWIKRIFGQGESNKAEAEERKGKETKQAAKEAKETADTKKGKKKSEKFSDEEREVLESWQSGNAKWKKQKKLPPGLQKKVDRGGELPPGWQKKLEVGETLDPEVAEQANSLPEEILKRFPQVEEGIEILEVGGEIIKVVEDSLEIIDILSQGPVKN